MIYIYTIELETGKYYIGKTKKDPGVRFQEHLSGRGAGWTRKYKPIKLINVIESDDPYDENKVTLKYMNEYGIENVRGGSFCRPELDEETTKIIKTMINGSEDVCYRCGKPGHFVRNCKAKTILPKPDSEEDKKLEINDDILYKLYDVINEYISRKKAEDTDDDISSGSEEWSRCEYCGKEMESEKHHKNHTKYCKDDWESYKLGRCLICGRKNHTGFNCFAKTHIRGHKIIKKADTKGKKPDSDKESDDGDNKVE